MEPGGGEGAKWRKVADRDFFEGVDYLFLF